MASVASAMPYDGRNARGSNFAGARLRGEVAQRARLDGLGAAAGDAQARQVEPLDVLVLQALGDERVGEVRRVGDGAAVLVDLVEPEARRAHEARRREEDAGDVGEERPDDEADEAHVVEERQPAHALVDAGVAIAGRGS